MPHVLNRRTMLWTILGVLGLRRRRSSVPSFAEVRYRRLKNTVAISLEKVAEVWRPAPFDARCCSPASAGGRGAEVVLKGILVRLPGPAGGAETLKAFCLTCPHEICQVDFIEDTELVRVEPVMKPDHPLLVCPCHFSVFDPLGDGARIAGPADRGLYRFRFEVEGDRVEIAEVEQEVLE
ncbi:MAG: ubiquinol-cytochrome c reductase iron-sulfur subunit [Acidobacteriota bacterium]